MTPENWAALRNMTDEEALANARADPDNPPLEDRPNARFRRVAFAKRVRWQLGMSQAGFAEAFGIALGTLRDWEQHRREPDQAAAAYLEVISHEPKAVLRARARKGAAGCHREGHDRRCRRGSDR